MNGGLHRSGWIECGPFRGRGSSERQTEYATYAASKGAVHKLVRVLSRRAVGKKHPGQWSGPWGGSHTDAR